MWIALLILVILVMACVVGVEHFSQSAITKKDLIVIYPHEIINSNYKVFKNRAPTESHFPDRYLLARPLPNPTTRYMSPEGLMRDCAIRGHRCSMIVENPRKEMWGYNQYYPILLEFRQDYNTYIGEKPKVVKVNWLKHDHEVPTDYKVYKDMAPRLAVLGTHGFKRSVSSAKKWCKRDNTNIDTPCRNFVHNKKTGFITTNQPGEYLYTSPGYDTYVGI